RLRPCWRRGLAPALRRGRSLVSRRDLWRRRVYSRRRNGAVVRIWRLWILRLRASAVLTDATDEGPTPGLPICAIGLVLRQRLGVLRHLQAGQQLDVARRSAGVFGLHAIVAHRSGEPIPCGGELCAGGLLVLHAGLEASRHDRDGGPAGRC